MCKPTGTAPTSVQFETDATAYLTKSMGPVLLGYGASTLRISGCLRNVLGNAALKPRYRKFTVRADFPASAAWTEGSAFTGSGDGNFSEDFSLAGLGANMFVQPAIAGGLTAAGTGEGFVNWSAFINTTARIVANQRVVLNPQTNSGKVAFLPIGNPFTALGLAGIMIAVSARGIAGNPAANFVGRTFEYDPTIPSAWGSNLMSDKTFSSINEDYNTGDLTYAPTDVAMAQIGLKLPAADADGTLDIIVAARYA